MARDYSNGILIDGGMNPGAMLLTAQAIILLE
jgi:hypothetical protein